MSHSRGTIVIPGGGGYLGRELSKYFVEQGFDAVILSRRPRRDTEFVRFVPWDGRTPGPWSKYFEGATAIINLSGRSVNCRYTTARKNEIYASRLDSTRAVGEAIARCATPPPVWINSSSATIYLHTYGPAWDESGEIGGAPEAKDAFSVDVCRRWESALWQSAVPQTRRIAMRLAMSFGPHGDVFNAFARIAKLGLGGPLGGGKQWVSWIHIHDFCRAVHWIIEHPELEGTVNVAAPNPLPNAEFVRELRQALGIPFGMPVTKWMLEIGAKVLGTETELLIKSRRVVPGQLLQSGFVFDYERWHDAVEAIVQAECNSAGS
ncbi:MAG: uncharacterized protein JWN98_693 [Abditibacteriota bacterium]|nr:uncharacterized protein [Abditibacteriota bacterium]